jgi:hypothetical protein
MVAVISDRGVGIDVPLDHRDSTVSVNACCCCICPNINRLDKNKNKGKSGNMNKV